MAPSIFHYEDVLNHPNVVALAERTDVPNVDKLINTLKVRVTSQHDRMCGLSRREFL